MGFAKSFLVTEFSIRELEDSGLAPKTAQALRHMRDRRFESSREFLRELGRHSPAPMEPAEEKLILKYSRQSLLRLEKLIPHRSTREWVEALVFALVVAVIVRGFIFAPFKIPSGSMIPTIEIGDHIFATMYSYGISVPFTGVRLFESEIERGDIVIFPYPLDPSIDYIKRVIAVGGETVRVEDTTVFINGEPLAEPYGYYDPLVLAHFRKNGSQPETYGPVTVPKGKIFVMGDNRFNSADSRAWRDDYGTPRPFVDVATVKGKGRIIYWSHDPDAGWLGGYRIGRIGGILK